ncbi:MAG TPA: UDP-N-acetylmuramate:L-alanyl-gamma-D-glutamyl-meso-diaminopimelate ligase [Gammaproteobacteria bacterium]|jgi:UDP-N-acetylmuramate: L-alanyl-gamma-D-glutamyl-meso-diaminopimelate ligase|nr:UDP-N-acetylmuramate:L-alanyl-gamma-D-glutamyl-meso-diaminopimelate ligase [Gammaproteobacteria bacterium]HIA43568.1 UDP-N-acetylmuramate:L-alanyl-gamma-D-glutamyl-meso-diaminopimelate ligase [Gammaproteobacteria bacterium]HIA95663.1 UDP-N-acetylmuramate:L-alanyl-gamma-D-glutamyl-meso-diaminopimelate ligase [Gammaproteobacteria bacterium]HIB75874.1 UDP-N-acetylmuramate:L-alanyl-gamma-D-glutamyl-meso-diaminopimelate ligase [Gammaproteobacteria bacterium]HIN74197.1 UDP-N-acetylmuramate:L-alany
MTVKKIHILGICGTFMGGLALLARELGFEVSGCDENVYPPMSDLLKEQNIKVIKGYNKKDLPEAELYLIGNVISRGNESIEHILDSKLPHTSGPAWLSENVLKNRRVIAVSGTHGKTSTTAMLTWILVNLGMDPGFLIAGKPKDFSVSAKLGKDEIFVIEADEYDTAFFDKRAKLIHYNPEVLIINNLEFDHADIYSNLPEIQKQFHNLIRTMSSEDCIVFPGDDKNIREVLDLGVWSKEVEFGVEGNSSNYFEAIKKDHSSVRFSINKKVAEINWNLLGEHNARNAITALLALQHFNLSLSDSAKSLESFSGVKRRLDTIIDRKDLKLFDDFAHHPTAIQETLKGLRSRYLDNRIIALIEIRSNTMKSGLHDKNLTGATSEADLVFWKGADKDQLNNLVNKSPEKNYVIDSVDSFSDELKNSIIKDNDVIIMMSNGSFDGLVDLLNSKL